MKRATGNLFAYGSLGLIGAMTMTSSAFAIIEPEETSGIVPKVHVMRPSTFRSSVAPFSENGVDMQYDQVSNAVRVMTGKRLLGVVVTSFDAASYEKAALKAVLSNKMYFGLDARDVRINSNATLAGKDDGSVMLHVYRGGVRVQDASVTLQFKNGALVQARNESYAEARAVGGDTVDTKSIAQNAIGGSAPVSRGSAYRVKPTNAGYSLVPVDEYLVVGMDDSYVVQVNRSSGEVFELRNKNINLRGVALGNVYPRYYGETLSPQPLSFAAPSNINGNADERGEFQSKDDFTPPELKGLMGQFVSVGSETGSVLSSKAQKVGDKWQIKFDVQANRAEPYDNNDAAQTMTYFQANKIIQIAKKYVSPEWFNKPLPIHVNHSRHCNAYWDGNSLNFFTAGSSSGKTCANSGLISDVVFHEWGHGLHENTSGIDDGAMSEGFGDALSVYMNDDSRIGIDFFPKEHKPVRDASVVKKYPDDEVGEVHKDGQIISGAWYDLYQGLKADMGAGPAHDLMGKFLFKGIYTFKKMQNVYDATLVLDDDDGDLSNGTPHLCVINKAFVRHGLAKEDSHCN